MPANVGFRARRRTSRNSSPARKKAPSMRLRAVPSPEVHPTDGTLFQLASQPCLGLITDGIRLRGKDAPPLGLAGSRIGQTLVLAPRADREQAGVPEADVPRAVRGDHVLVPRHVAQRRGRRRGCPPHG